MPNSIDLYLTGAVEALKGYMARRNRGKTLHRYELDVVKGISGEVLIKYQDDEGWHVHHHDRNLIVNGAPEILAEVLSGVDGTGRVQIVEIGAISPDLIDASNDYFRLFDPYGYNYFFYFVQSGVSSIPVAVDEENLKIPIPLSTLTTADQVADAIASAINSIGATAVSLYAPHTAVAVGDKVIVVNEQPGVVSDPLVAVTDAGFTATVKASGLAKPANGWNIKAINWGTGYVKAGEPLSNPPYTLFNPRKPKPGDLNLLQLAHTDTSISHEVIAQATGAPLTAVKFTSTLNKLEGNGASGTVYYTEAGLFTENGRMFSYKTFPLMTKNEYIKIVLEWTIKFIVS